MILPQGIVISVAAENIAAKEENARWLKSKINQCYKIYEIGLE